MAEIGEAGLCEHLKIFGVLNWRPNLTALSTPNLYQVKIEVRRLERQLCLIMQERNGGSDPIFRKPKPKKKHPAALQPKTSVQLSSIQKEKSTAPRAAKIPRKSQKAVKKLSVTKEVIYNNTSMVPAKTTRPVIDMLGITEGDSRNLYRALKRKYLLLEEESYALAEELEKTEAEVQQLQEEKSALLDELLVLEGLAFNPYPPFQPFNKNSQAPPLGQP